MPKATSQNELLYEISYTVINFHMHKDLVHIVQTNILTEWTDVSNFTLSVGSSQYQEKLYYRFFQDNKGWGGKGGIIP